MGYDIHRRMVIQQTGRNELRPVLYTIYAAGVNDPSADHANFSPDAL